MPRVDPELCEECRKGEMGGLTYPVIRTVPRDMVRDVCVWEVDVDGLGFWMKPFESPATKWR